jgi:glucose-6-phosphate isomerase/transaldolase/glucose-6-phosphate isomerase
MSTRYQPALNLVDRFLQDRLVSRIWAREIGAWGAAPGSADAKSIASRLGWLDTGDTMRPHLERLAALGRAAREEQIEAVYLLGMGGSSLCAEVLRSVLGVAEGSPQLYVLDTTDEATITTVAARMQPARTWFLVSSKSGGTVEVASMERFFWSKVQPVLGERTGRQFIAITDPGTGLNTLATSRGYREIFVNPPDIGGP